MADLLQSWTQFLDNYKGYIWSTWVLVSKTQLLFVPTNTREEIVADLLKEPGQSIICFDETRLCLLKIYVKTDFGSVMSCSVSYHSGYFFLKGLDSIADRFIVLPEQRLYYSKCVLELIDVFKGWLSQPYCWFDRPIVLLRRAISFKQALYTNVLDDWLTFGLKQVQIFETLEQTDNVQNLQKSITDDSKKCVNEFHPKNIKIITMDGIYDSDSDLDVLKKKKWKWSNEIWYSTGRIRAHTIERVQQRLGPHYKILCYVIEHPWCPMYHIVNKNNLFVGTCTFPEPHEAPAKSPSHLFIELETCRKVLFEEIKGNFVTSTKSLTNLCKSTLCQNKEIIHKHEYGPHLAKVFGMKLFHTPNSD